MQRKRLFNWNHSLLNAISRQSGVCKATIVSNVKLLAKMPSEEILVDPKPYCSLHKIELKKSLLETKNCVDKNCPHLTYVKKIVKFSD